MKQESKKNFCHTFSCKISLFEVHVRQRLYLRDRFRYGLAVTFFEKKKKFSTSLVHFFEWSDK